MGLSVSRTDGVAAGEVTRQMGLGFCQLGQWFTGVTLTFNFLTQSHFNLTHFAVLFDSPFRLLCGLQQWEQGLLQRLLHPHAGGPFELLLFSFSLIQQMAGAEPVIVS
jgi:hypothetical protein